MITAAQLRAARGLLDWTRSELAKASGLSAETIKNIEHGIYTPQETTIAAIVNAFAQHNIEFTSDEGVRKMAYQVRVFRGRSGYRQFLDHIYSVMHDNGGVIRQFNLSDGNNLPHAEEYADFHLERMSHIKNLDAKVLTNEGDFCFPAKYCEYRWLKKENNLLMPFYLYNEFIEMPFHRDENNIELIIIHSPQLAINFKKQFDIFWNQSNIPDKSVKDQ